MAALSVAGASVTAGCGAADPPRGDDGVEVDGDIDAEDTDNRDRPADDNESGGVSGTR